MHALPLYTTDRPTERTLRIHVSSRVPSECFSACAPLMINANSRISLERERVYVCQPKRNRTWMLQLWFESRVPLRDRCLFLARLALADSNARSMEYEVHVPRTCSLKAFRSDYFSFHTGERILWTETCTRPVWKSSEISWIFISEYIIFIDDRWMLFTIFHMYQTTLTNLS